MIHQGFFKIVCPKHPRQKIYRMEYHSLKMKRPIKKNPKGKTGLHKSTNWFYCPKCDMAYEVDFRVVAKGKKY